MKNLIIILVTLQMVELNAQSWVANDGRALDGEFMDLKDESVVIRRQRDLKTFKIPLENLTEDSRQQARNIYQEREKKKQLPFLDFENKRVNISDCPRTVDVVELSSFLSDSPFFTESRDQSFYSEGDSKCFDCEFLGREWKAVAGSIGCTDYCNVHWVFRSEVSKDELASGWTTLWKTYAKQLSGITGSETNELPDKEANSYRPLADFKEMTLGYEANHYKTGKNYLVVALQFPPAYRLPKQ